MYNACQKRHPRLFYFYASITHFLYQEQLGLFLQTPHRIHTMYLAGLLPVLIFYKYFLYLALQFSLAQLASASLA